MYIVVGENEYEGTILLSHVLYSDCNEARKAAQDIVKNELNTEDETTVFVYKVKDTPLSTFYWKVQED